MTRSKMIKETHNLGIASASPWHLLRAGLKCTCQSWKLRCTAKSIPQSPSKLMTQMPAVANNSRAKRFQMLWNGQNIAANVTLNGSNGKLFNFWWRILKPPTTVATSHEFTTICRWSVSTQHLHNASCATALDPAGKQKNKLRDRSNNWNHWNYFEWGWFEGAIRPLQSSGWPVSWSPFPTLDFRKRNRKAMKSHEVMRRFALFLSSTFNASVNPLDHAILCDFLFTWSWLHSGPGSWKRIVADLMAHDLFDDHTAHHWSACDIMSAIMWHHVTWLPPRSLRRLPLIDQTTRMPQPSSGMEGKPSSQANGNDAKCEVEASLMSQIELGAAQHKAGTLADTQQGDVDPLPWATRLGDGWRRSLAPAAPTPLHPASQKACPNSVPSECPGWATAKASRVARPIWVGTKCAKGCKKVDKSWKEPTGELGSECQRNALL